MRGTHTLEMVSGGTSQDRERIRPSEGHSHAGDGVGRNKSGQRKDPTGRGALTNWTRHRDGQVRTQKESDPARGTHQLETVGREKSGHGENPTARGALTDWRRHREGQVKTQKESDRVRGTHILETASGGTSQDTERIRPNEGHSHTGNSIVWTTQDTERTRLRPNEGHSQAEDSIGRDKSGHRKNPTERRARTLWRRHREGQVRTQKASALARALTGWRRHREGHVRT